LYEIRQVDQTQTIIHCTATVTAVQTSRPRHESVKQILSGWMQKHRTEFGTDRAHKVVTTLPTGQNPLCLVREASRI